MQLNAKIALSCALIGLGAPACAAELEPEPSVASADQMLTEIEVDGAHVRFIEMEPGFPIALAQSEPGKNPLADVAVRNMNLVQLYEHWTKQPAPETLRAAQERSMAINEADVAIPDEPPFADVVPEAAELVDKLTGPQFMAAYCQDMPICLTERSGTAEIERKSAWIYGWINPYIGNVTLQIRVYKVVGGWQNTLVADLYQGGEYRYTGGGNPLVPRSTKVKIFNADGDWWNWSMTW